MSDYEDRIRRALDVQAARIDAQPEPEELTDRIAGRERRRTRALSAALVITLFAGPTLGFVLGRGGADNEVRAAGNGGDGVTVGHPGALPKLDSSSASNSLTATAQDLLRIAPGASSGAGSTGSMVAAGVSQPLARVYVRDVNGVRLRVYRAEVEQQDENSPPWWEPPGWCFPNGLVQADVSSDDTVGIVTANVYAALRDGDVGGSLWAIGVAEGAPLWVAVVQTPADAARVRVTFPGGGTDEMAPVDGIATLVHSASLSTDRPYFGQQANVEAFDASGQPLGRGVARVYGAETGQNQDACTAPAQLPAPGAEQPADVGAATQAVTDAFNVAHSNAQPDDARTAVIDDPAGLPEIWAQNQQGPYKDQIASSVITLDGVVFASPTKGYFKYHWETPGYPSYGARFGEAVLVDGTWKVTRASMCQDITLMGVSCK
jgi:hypothetical protein